MDDVLRGIIIGYEAAIRMGNCIQPGHRARGFHASGTVGTIGAAMGVAALLENAEVTAVDKGALDCTLKARVECAVFRSADASAANIPWGGIVR